MSSLTGGGPSPDGAQMMQVAVKGAQAQNKMNEGVQKAGGAQVLAGAAVIGTVATGVIASTIGLPLVGALAIGGGVATAGAAAFGSGQKSDIARKAGKATADTAKSVRAFDKKHDITGKTVRAAKATANKASEFDKKHHVTKNIGSAVTSIWNKASDINKKYSITDKTGKALSKGLDAVSGALEGSDKKTLTEGEAKQ